MMFAIDGLQPVFVWGIFTRALALVYMLSFVSLYHQIVPLAGSRGITPVHELLLKIQSDFPGIRRFFYFPTLLWFNAGDRFLKMLVLTGIGLSALVVYGGPYSHWCLFGCWLIYLSLDIAIELVFPWDCLLFEAGFLAIFLPQLHVLPDLSAVQAPAVLVAWAYRWLLFRVIFGFGKKKFLGATAKDRSYIKSFLINQPIPSPLAWYACRWPTWVFVFMLAGMFFTEVIAPFLIFIPGYPRLLAAAAIASLMIGIQLFGNFGYFNLLTAVLCIPLLDCFATIFDLSIPELYESPRAIATSLVAVVVLTGGLLYLPLDSWCSRGWTFWPIHLKVRNPLLRCLIGFYRLLSPFRIVNAYGVFPPQCAPAVRWLPVIEGAGEDGIWREYTYRYIPSSASSPPRFVAPYHPRLDHGIFYEAYGLNTRFLTSALQGRNPYRSQTCSDVDRLLQRILEGDAPLLKLFGINPFPDAGRPPKQMRVRCFLYQPATIAHRRATGEWWVRRCVGLHVAARECNDAIWNDFLPDSELFHWDDVFWRRRTAGLRALRRHPAEGISVSPEERRRFWSEFGAVAGRPDSIHQRDLAATAKSVRDRFSVAELREIERTMALLAAILLAELEPFWCGRRKPAIICESYFHLCLLVHHIMACGRDAFERALSNPECVAEEVDRASIVSGLYYPAIVWYDDLVFYARKVHIVRGIITLDGGHGVLGFLDLIPFIAEQFAEPDQELPVFTQSIATGEWSIHARDDPKVGL